MKKLSRGFSVTELLVVVAIIGILALVAVPNFVTMMRGMGLKTSMREFAAQLRGARQRAISRDEMVKVTFAPGLTSRTYTILSAPNGDPETATWTPVGSNDTGIHELDKSVYFGDTTFEDEDNPADGKRDIVFHPSGAVSPLPTETEGTNTVTLLRLRSSWDVPINEFKFYFKLSGNFETKSAHF